MDVRQQQLEPLGRRLPVHAPQQFGKELAVNVGQHDADRIGAGHAQVARAGMGNIAERRRRIFDALAQCGADIVVAVHHTRHRCDGHRRFARYIADGRIRHAAFVPHPYPVTTATGAPL